MTAANLRPDELEQIRRVWWALAALGEPPPAEAGVIVIDGGGGHNRQLDALRRALPAGFSIWETVWGEFALDRSTSSGDAIACIGFFETPEKAFDAALVEAYGRGPRTPGGAA